MQAHRAEDGGPSVAGLVEALRRARGNAATADALAELQKAVQGAPGRSPASSRATAAEAAACGAVPLLAVSLIRGGGDAAVVAPAVSLLDALCSCTGSAANIQAAVAAGCLPPLVAQCESPDALVAMASANVLCKIVSAGAPLAAAAAAAGAAPALAGLLRSGAALGRGVHGAFGVRCALPALAAVTSHDEAVGHLAASGALGRMAAWLRQPDTTDVAAFACDFLIGSSDARLRALAADPAVVPALVAVMTADAPAATRDVAVGAQILALAMLGRMAAETAGALNWWEGAPPHAIPAALRRAGGVPKMVALLRASLDAIAADGAAAAGGDAHHRRLAAFAMTAVASLAGADPASCAEALAGGALPVLARAAALAPAARAGAPPDGVVLHLLERSMSALCAVVYGGGPHAARAAAEQPGLAASLGSGARGRDERVLPGRGPARGRVDAGGRRAGASGGPRVHARTWSGGAPGGLRYGWPAF
jgi:hypothetical protein